jgi:uncharacterized coiled-coil protein SlyX
MYLNQEVARQKNEIGFLNRAIGELRDLTEIKKLQRRMDDFAESVAKDMEGVLARVKSLGESFLVYQEKVKNQFAMADAAHSRLIFDKFSKIQEMLAPLESLKDRLDAIESEMHPPDSPSSSSSSSKKSKSKSKKRSNSPRGSIGGPNDLEHRLKALEEACHHNDKTLKDRLTAIESAKAPTSRSGSPSARSDRGDVPPLRIPGSDARRESDLRRNSDQQRGSPPRRNSDAYPGFDSRPLSPSFGQDTGGRGSRRDSSRQSPTRQSGRGFPDDELGFTEDMTGDGLHLDAIARVVNEALARKQREIAAARAADLSRLYIEIDHRLVSCEGRLAVCEDRISHSATRDDLVGMAWELANQNDADNTAVGAVPCRCLACGKPKASLTKANLMADGTLLRMLTCGPLSARTEKAQTCARVVKAETSLSARKESPRTNTSLRRRK